MLAECLPLTLMNCHGIVRFDGIISPLANLSLIDITRGIWFQWIGFNTINHNAITFKGREIYQYCRRQLLLFDIFLLFIQYFFITPYKLLNNP